VFVSTVGAILALDLGKFKSVVCIYNRDFGEVTLAGLWEHWKPPEGDAIETCVIVTTAANEVASKYHDRMPVIVDAGDYSRWLDPAASNSDLLPLLESRTVNGLEVAAANPLVNNPRNQGPELLQPTSQPPNEPA
jgi:putative SOS response-associated peptidase YedK